jgi:hypothetical protein
MNEGLTGLGNEIIVLSHVLYGSACNPLDKVSEISAYSGIRCDLITAALLVTTKEDKERVVL